MVIALGNREYQFAEALVTLGGLRRANALKLFSDSRHPRQILDRVENKFDENIWCKREKYRGQVFYFPTETLLLIFSEMKIDSQYRGL